MSPAKRVVHPSSIEIRQPAGSAAALEQGPCLRREAIGLVAVAESARRQGGVGKDHAAQPRLADVRQPARDFSESGASDKPAPSALYSSTICR